eukprot:TRINITY_DN30475_c0_g1_i1.p1 TRINITY_DN30475_c0_g1~~TRINITY_DN30475_c0_g1_i1.p1  ORF type:complete len:933 (+),score=200.33 TRINITY_DN30475_c0_g1_i1:76-2874(+)
MADNRVAFSVAAEWSGRKFKIMLDEKDINGMKAEKIIKTLSKFTNLPSDEFDIRTQQGMVLAPGMKGIDFGLAANVVLLMYKKPPIPVKAAGKLTPPPPTVVGETGISTKPSVPAPLVGSVQPLVPSPVQPPLGSPNPAAATSTAVQPVQGISNVISLPIPQSKPQPQPQPVPQQSTSGSAFQSRDSRDISPMRSNSKSPTPLRPLGLNPEQVKLQERLLAEAQTKAPVPSIHDVLGQSYQGASLLHTPRGISPTVSLSRQPSASPLHFTGPPTPAVLEATIKKLRAENEALRVENKTALQMKKRGRSNSPGWAQSQQQSTARGRSTGSESEMRQLLRKCNELAATRHTLENNLELLKREWTDERRLRMSEWEADHLDWTKRQHNLVMGWEHDKQLLLNATLSKEDIMQIHSKWECIDQKWEEERTALQSNLNYLTQRRDEEERNKLSEQEEILQQLTEKRNNLLTTTRELKTELAKSRHATEENKKNVVGATQQLEILQTEVCTAGIPADVAKALIQLSTEKAMHLERASTLKAENQQLTNQLDRETHTRKHLHNTLEDMKGSIRAIIRMRPVLPHEQHAIDDEYGEQGYTTITDSSVVTVSTPTTGVKEYSFYKALGPDIHQQEVFAEVRPLLQSTLDGYNVSVMAYGQTGSGKTYTIMGGQTAASRGVLPRTIQELFKLLGSSDCTAELTCSMVELYLDTPRDLLDPDQKKCELHQLPTGLSVTASEHAVNTAEEALSLLKMGGSHRQVHSTLMNPQSSRSHAVFTLDMKIRIGNSITTSKLSFVDLAGSERVKVSHSKGDRLKEAQTINKSLSALGDVVAALSQGSKSNQSRPFIPYRNSKLTMILQDALGGNSKTVLFACICPGLPGTSTNMSETVSTLVFASRIKLVRNPFVRSITKIQNLANSEAAESHQDNAAAATRVHHANLS